MRQIYPGPAGPDTAAAPDLAALYRYPADAGHQPWVRANMVSSADGAATLSGRSGGLSGKADQQIFAMLRGLADVILVGAGTARAERYGPAEPGDDDSWAALRDGRPPTAPIAVISRGLGLDLDGPLLTKAPEGARTILITSGSAPAGRRDAAARHADVIVAGADAVNLPAAVGALAERGYRRVLSEGGPRLLAQLAGTGVLDELCLTVSPLLAGGTAGRIVDAAGGAAQGSAGQIMVPDSAGAEGAGGLSLSHVLEDDGYLLCRYVCRRAIGGR
jgi:riboflavin biosynthesis pyrimidine reductase